MKHLTVFTFLLLFSVLFVLTKVDAGFSCIPFISSPQARCEDIGTNSPPGGTPVYDNIKDCLIGGADGSFACKNDPRYQLRNFAPFLNFPNIGSMLNLGTALITVLGGLLCGVFMFSGAFNYLNAGGDAKKLESARSRIVYALIGLLIVLFAYTIVKLILDTTSTNTVGF